MHFSEWLSFAVSFATVLALLGGVLYVLKKMQNGSLLGLPARKVRVLETLSVGPRQKIALLRVKDRDILVGVTVQQMTPLASWELTPEDLAEAEAQPARAPELPSSLGQRFAEMMKSAQNKGGE